MKRNVFILGFIFSLSLCDIINAQLTKTAFRGGYLNVIPGDFTLSGRSRVYTYDWGGSTDMSTPVVVYGRDFNTIERQFSIPRPKPGNIKAEYACVSLSELAPKIIGEVKEITGGLDVDSLLQLYNDSIPDEMFEYCGLNHYHYEVISSPEILETIITSILLLLQFQSFESFDDLIKVIGFYDSDGNICCTFCEKEYARESFYDYNHLGYKYPYKYFAIENDTLYYIMKEYDAVVEIPAGHSFDWQPVEISKSRNGDQNEEGFIWNLTYSNYDDLTFYENNITFLTQTLFNKDEKYEYLTYKYDVGDWTKYDKGNNNDDVPYVLTTYGLSDYIYYDNAEYKIKDAKELFDTYQITFTNCDSQNLYLVRNVYYRNVTKKGVQVLTDNGVVLFSYDSSPDAINGINLEIFTYNSRNYLHVIENRINHTIFEILPTTNSINVVERISQPFASAQDGVINMILDNAHTDSNAELYNMSGQSMGSRYIKKGETRPSMSAAGLPDGIYNLLLNRNGEIINSQKMLIK